MSKDQGMTIDRMIIYAEALLAAMDGDEEGTEALLGHLSGLEIAQVRDGAHMLYEMCNGSYTSKANQ